MSRCAASCKKIFWLSFASKRKTVIFVTHSIEEAVYLSDQIVLLTRHPGRVVSSVRPDLDRNGDPEDIRRDPNYLDMVDRIWSQLKEYLS